MNSTVVKTSRIVISVSAAVALSIACSAFFLKSGKRTGQDAQREVKIAGEGVTRTKPLIDALPQPIGKKPSPKTIEADSGGQQLKGQSKWLVSRVKDKPLAVAKASPQAAVEVPDTKQRVAKKYDQMFATQANKLLQSPFSAAHSLVEKEVIDETWAPEASQLLADSYSDLGSRLDVSMINCRTDICEIRINSWPGGDYSGDLDLVRNRLEFIKQQPWFQQEFDETSSMAAFLEDGLPLMVIFVTRK
ncbi:MAG: hypothetical protein JSS13_04270 [Proteobacteria bacterium]|nr:hypothetical protein [Pseudomonadota bacterium]